ncbi:C10 family peptidase [Catalinimonas sp. 4WD22]|uniref:C10 family peptidase n=1 Tax=Catalinimonas locisalis TaxID=3133978 RepID=UPI0031010E3E
MSSLFLPGKTMAHRLFILSQFFCFWLFSLFCLGAEVTPEQAEIIAREFLSHRLSQTNGRVQSVELQLSYVKRMPASSNTRQSIQPLYYIFNNETDGFVIVSGDDAAYPILGFSDEGNFDVNQLPDAYRKWVDHYEQQLRQLIREEQQPTARISKAWRELGSESTKAVAPLMSTKWNQSPYFNDMCPYDAEYGESVVVGCVATAMAQIMKYHNYPERGSGFYSYQHRTYGTISADFGLAEYAWDQMPDEVNAPNEAVALLSFHAGVSVDMQYGVNSSGSAGAVLVQPALQKYFQYEAELAHREQFTQEQWVSLLQSELDAGRPIYYEGMGNGAGHAFVCDGYQDDEFFHFNWGWGGMMDGYYYINDLSPSELGTGGGNGSYNSDQAIVYGITPKDDNGGQDPNEPTDPESFDMQLYSEIQIDPNPILFANPFTVDVQVANFGLGEFSGQLAAVITNRENITEILDSVSFTTFEAQTYYELNFSSEGLPIATPGTYALAIFYKAEDGDWQLVNSDTYAPVLDVEVLGSDNDMTLSAALTLESASIMQGQSYSVSFNVTNYGDLEFTGTIYAALYDLEGYYQDMVDSIQIPSLPSGFTFEENLSLGSAGTEIEPGTYLLALFSGNGTDTLLLAGGEYVNPVAVIVQAPPIAADAYEDNDTEVNAFSLDVSQFTNNQSSVKITDANQHTELDYDYYQLDLPAGPDYEINVRVHDSYDSQDGLTYTNDVIFSFKKAGTDWSEAFDTEMDENIVVAGGGKVLLWVSPYFAGQLGTYALDIQVNRQQQQQLISLSSPVNGASWQSGSTQEISWESNFIENVSLELYKGENLQFAIAENISNSGSYMWQLPDTMTTASDYWIAIYNTEDANVYDFSDFFKVDKVTGLGDALSVEIRLYPNPIVDLLHMAFEHERPLIVEIYDAQGRFLEDIPVNHEEVSINMQHLSQGLYLVHCIWAEGQQTIHKVLKP